MNLYQFLITSACVFTLSAAHAELDSQQAYTTEYEEDLSFQDEEVDAFEEEILALEEELKQDAESFEESLSTMEEDLELTTDSFNPPEETLTTDSFFEEPETFEDIEEAVTQVEGEPADLIEAENELVLESPVESAEDTLQASQIEPDLVEPLALTELDQDALQGQPVASLQVEELSPKKMRSEAIEVNLEQAFSGSPYIYTLLGIMSVSAVGIWLYSQISLRTYGGISSTFTKNLQNKLNSNQFEDALSLCTLHDSVFSKMIASGIQTRRHGLPLMIEAMKAEGKRASVSFWQKLGLLNDIAILAPMLGLLGTVLGMFYAFYDINRSIESISTLFDGLGVSVGTTVAGLGVAILSLILHSTAKYRLVKTLAHVENEAQTFATLIDDRTSVYKA